MITWSKAKLSPAFAWIYSQEGERWRGWRRQKGQQKYIQAVKVHSEKAMPGNSGWESKRECYTLRHDLFDCAVLGTTEHILHFHSLDHTHLLACHHDFSLCHGPDT